MEESIKSFPGKILNADWEELHYHNEILLFGNTVVIIRFLLFPFFFKHLEWPHSYSPLVMQVKPSGKHFHILAISAASTQEPLTG